MGVKLKNRRVTRDEAHAYAAMVEENEARYAAKEALWGWYAIGARIANDMLPKLQVDSNLEMIARIPGWQQRKGVRNGYIMLFSNISGTLTPMIVVLDFEKNPSGRLTGTQLHKQVREMLQLETIVSLRMCPFKPWYRYMQDSFPVPEKKAVPASPLLCTHLLGTTLLYYTYVHRR